MAVPKLRFKADDGSDYPEWNDFTKLEDISAFITKGAKPTTYGFDWKPNGVYFFRNDCIKNNVFVYGDYSFIAEEANKFLQRSEVTGGDIVIAITGDIGKVGLIPSEVKKANINQHLARVRIVKDAFPYFVYMYLCSDKVQRTYKKIKTGLSMPQLSLAQIRDTNIPVVSLPEQQKIAEFLSTIDTVIEKQKETVSAWEERKKGVMQKLFSQEVRFKADDGSEFPDWEEKKLGDCCSLITKGTTPKEYPENGDVNFVRIDCIENGSINISKCLKINEQIHNGELARSVLKENDLLCSIAGALGVVTVVTKDILPANTNQALAILRLYESENVQYISKTLSSYIMEKYIRECKTVGAQPNLSLGQMRDLIIPYPCSDEQQKIADCLSSLDEVIEKQKATLAAWEELKKGLLQQMVV